MPNSERRLFAEFAPKWWETVRERGLKQSTFDLDMGMRPVMFSLALFVVGVLVNALFMPWKDVLDDAITSIRSGVVVVIVAGLWYVYYLFVVARRRRPHDY